MTSASRPGDGRSGSRYGWRHRVPDCRLDAGLGAPAWAFRYRNVAIAARPGAAFPRGPSIAVSAIALVKTIRKVALHWQAYLEWQANTQHAKSAMSIEVAAMANRMNISRGERNDEIMAGAGERGEAGGRRVRHPPAHH